MSTGRLFLFIIMGGWPTPASATWPRWGGAGDDDDMGLRATGGDGRTSFGTVLALGLAITLVAEEGFVGALPKSASMEFTGFFAVGVGVA